MSFVNFFYREKKLLVGESREGRRGTKQVIFDLLAWPCACGTYPGILATHLKEDHTQLEKLICGYFQVKCLLGEGFI